MTKSLHVIGFLRRSKPPCEAASEKLGFLPRPPQSFLIPPTLPAPHRIASINHIAMSPSDVQQTTDDPFANVDTIPLAIVDFSDFDTDPRARARVSQEIAKACDDVGFFVLVNHGIDGVERQFDIARQLFALPDKEKERFNMEATGAKGNYFGYKRIGQQIINAKGQGDGNEYFNVEKPTVGQRAKPKPIQDNIEEINRFQKDSHDLILKLLSIFAEQLGLEHDHFAKLHRWTKPSGDMIRMIRYPPRSDEEDQKTGGVKMVGHTDVSFPRSTSPSANLTVQS